MLSAGRASLRGLGLLQRDTQGRGAFADGYPPTFGKPIAPEGPIGSAGMSMMNFDPLK